MTYRESLRDIVACLNCRLHLRYHLGLRGRMTRTNLAYANEHRDWRVFAAVAQVLIRRANALYREATPDPDFPQVALALDSSIIHLSLKLFPWAYWGRSRSGGLEASHAALLQRQPARMVCHHRSVISRYENPRSNPH